MLQIRSLVEILQFGGSGFNVPLIGTIQQIVLTIDAHLDYETWIERIGFHDVLIVLAPIERCSNPLCAADAFLAFLASDDFVFGIAVVLDASGNVQVIQFTIENPLER